MTISVSYERLFDGNDMTSSIEYPTIKPKEEESVFKALLKDAHLFSLPAEKYVPDPEALEKETKITISYTDEFGVKESVQFKGPWWKVFAYRTLKETAAYLIGYEKTPKLEDDYKEWIETLLDTNVKTDDLKSIKDEVLSLLEINQDKWLKSQELQVAYEQAFDKKIKLSTLSTYLLRSYRAKILDRTGSHAQREYFYPGSGLEVDSKTAYERMLKEK